MSGPDREDGPPPMAPDQARLESAMEAAIARGDFADLPGAGKPLRLPETDDPDWWIKQRIAEDDVDRDALLPVVMLLRREYERRASTLVELRSEDAVREYAEDYSRRVREDRLRTPGARTLAPELDADAAVAQWRELRAAAAPADPAPTPPAPTRRRWWWPFSRS